MLAKNERLSFVLAALLAAAVPFASASTKAAETGSRTARDLYNLCREPANSGGRAVCLGYIGGVADILIDLHDYYDIRLPFNPALYTAGLTCFGHFDVDAARKAFLTSVERDDRNIDRIDALARLLMALHETWPCRR